MPVRTPARPKLTDAERHERFVAMAKVVGASDDPKDFDRAFEKVITGRLSKFAKGPHAPTPKFPSRIPRPDKE
jgi:hypothetical protein